jgi:hypothetical protein
MARSSKTNTKGVRDSEGAFFGSQAELNRWRWLQAEEAAGRITGLQRQVTFDICINWIKVGKYRADAVYMQPATGPGADPFVVRVVEDVKGWVGQGNWPFRKKVIEAACGFVIREVPAAEWSDRAVAQRAKEAAQ